MDWILIAWTLTWGNDAIAVQTADFDSSAACENAGVALQSAPSPKRSQHSWEFVCVGKGAESLTNEKEDTNLLAWVESRGFDAIETTSVTFNSADDCKAAGNKLQATFTGRRATGLYSGWQFICASKGEIGPTE